MTPGYKIKHWWRKTRRENESLREFAKNMRDNHKQDNPNEGVASAWMFAKGIK